MRIAHIADIHWGLGYPGPTPQSRFDDICRVMDWAADRMIAERVDLVLVAGDMFRKADVSLEKASREIRAAVAWLRKLTNAGIEVLVISGTPSHDPISAYELLKAFELPGVRIVTGTDVIDFETNHAAVSIACLPGMDRSSFTTKEDYRGLPAHVMHQMMTEWITDMCCKMYAETTFSKTILLGHLTYDLADTGFEDVLMQNEAILTQDAIRDFSLICLGHIHRRQQNGKVFYAGSPERLSFNDEKQDAGFWIYDIDDEEGITPRFIDTPARKYLTLRWDEKKVEQFIENRSVTRAIEGGGEIIRVHYECSENLNKLLDRRKLESELYDAGAFFVTEIRGNIARADRQRDAELTEQLGPIEAVRKWCANQELPAEEIDELAAMTAQLTEVPT